MQSKSLPIPDNADQLPGAQEILRVWVTDEGERITLQPTADIPIGAWGILLADLARHAARAYAQQGRGDPNANLGEVMAHLLAEFKAPTDRVQGETRGPNG